MSTEGEKEDTVKEIDVYLSTEHDEFTYEKGARSLNRLTKCVLPLCYALALIVFFTRSAQDMEGHGNMESWEHALGEPFYGTLGNGQNFEERSDMKCGLRPQFEPNIKSEERQ